MSAAAAENVYVAKLFAYQFVNAYCALFYIAFWVRDMDNLQEVHMIIVSQESFMV